MDLYGLLWTGLAIIMLRGTYHEGVVSLPPRDGCVGESLDPVLGSVYSAAFWWVCSAEALHNEEQNKKYISVSLKSVTVSSSSS